MMFSCCLMCICKNITEEMSVYNAFLLIYIYIYISFIGFVHVDPYSSGSTLYNIQVSAVSVQRFFGLKCLEKVPKHTSHSKQQNHQI